METIFTITAVIQTLSISLGVGCSTLAILNFFAAIADGTIDETERRMMGVVYIVLRVAMVLILLTTFTLGVITYLETQNLNFSAFLGAVWTLIVILYLNALLMTLHIVPSTIGPAIQASAWYTLGVITALVPLNLVNFSYGQFALIYITAFVLAVAIVNGVMWWLSENRKRVTLRD